MFNSLTGERMKNFAIVAMLACALSACADKSPPAADVQTTEQKAQRGDQTPKSETPRPTQSSNAGANAAERSAEIQQRLCPAVDPSCASAGPLSARSPAEAQWLIQHGYPSEQENAKLHAASLQSLQEMAASGNRPAAVVYAERIALEAGKFTEGSVLLYEQAKSGNLFAYYGLSKIYYDDPSHGSLVDSAAYLKVAYLLGDSRASELLDRPKLGTAELLSADKRAAGLLETFSGGVERSPRPLE